MSELFYKPRIVPDFDYLSEKEFKDTKDREIEDKEEPENPDSLDDVKDEAIRIAKEIDKIKEIINILPGNLPQTYRDALNKIQSDLLNPPPINKGGGSSDMEIESETETDTIPGPSYNGDIVIKIGDTEFDSILLFPEDNDINVKTTKVGSLILFIRKSFLKDKNDMYGNFVQKLKLMIQQYMRELLYIAKIGHFKSYLDLYVRFDTPSVEVSKDLKAAADRILKYQIDREQKTRLLNKIFNIDQTVVHLIANKVSYEQRQRYYDMEYLEAKDYIETQENDELRKLRLEYDKKYEQSMYNYYKYLTGSTILTDEILKTFLSEARGKALLNKNGIDTQKGYKEEQEKQKQVEAELKKKTEETQKKEEEKQKALLEELKGAGRDSSYSGSYGDKSGVVNSNGSAVNKSVPGSEAEPVSGSVAEKIVKMALQAWNKRGPNSGNPIKYSMKNDLRSYKIFNSNTTHSDCSAFVKGVVLEATGIDVGSNTSDQVNKNKNRQWVFNINELQPGDLIYFKALRGDKYQGHAITLNGKSYNVSHTLIYLGDKEVIECTNGANGLRKFNFTSGWHKTNYMEPRFIGAFRL
ncbi:C40 family peptidase [Lysinibacillus pakistanensis]|uniref:C40 family peptidase n=1 Tax=Lysinibacillus pakistanensis TaxID=759811 RepID=UPI003D2BF921